MRIKFERVEGPYSLQLYMPQAKASTNSSQVNWNDIRITTRFSFGFQYRILTQTICI